MYGGGGAAPRRGSRFRRSDCGRSPLAVRGPNYAKCDLPFAQLDALRQLSMRPIERKPHLAQFGWWRGCPPAVVPRSSRPSCVSAPAVARFEGCRARPFPRAFACFCRPGRVAVPPSSPLILSCAPTPRALSCFCRPRCAAVPPLLALSASGNGRPRKPILAQVGECQGYPRIRSAASPSLTLAAPRCWLDIGGGQTAGLNPRNQPRAKCLIMSNVIEIWIILNKYLIQLRKCYAPLAERR